MRPPRFSPRRWIGSLAAVSAVALAVTAPAGAATADGSKSNLGVPPAGVEISPESCSYGYFGPNGRIGLGVCRTEYSLPALGTKRVSVNVRISNDNPIGLETPYFISSLVLTNEAEDQVLEVCAYKGWIRTGESTNCTASVPSGGKTKARVFYNHTDTGSSDSVTFTLI